MEIEIVIGHICAGKTAYCKQRVKNNTHIRLSMDDLKVMMYGHITSEKMAEDIVSASIEWMVTVIHNIDDFKKDIIIDGFPLIPEAFGYLLDTYPETKIRIFTIDLFKANLRNRKRKEETGIWIDPKHIMQYNRDFDKLIKSKEFLKVMNKEGIRSFYHNYHLTNELIKDCLEV